MKTDLIWRSAKDVIIKKDLEDKLASGQKLRIKYGIDPTAPIIHIGRAVPIRKLRLLQDMGHKIVLIIGDFTAKIGDASDKSAERKPLTDDEIKSNMADYKRQLGLLIDLKKAEIHYNSKWLAKLKPANLIELAKHFTVAQMIERENFHDRYKANKPIGLHEFLYPLLQGYDSVAIKADVEIGGTDQLFNLMAGRILQKIYHQPSQNVITYDLLEGLDGRKMSSSWGNTILVTNEPSDMYGKVMAIHDDLIIKYYELCTDIDMTAIQALEKTLAAGANPRDAKASLAREIVRIYHGDKAAKTAEAEFNRQFRDGRLPTDIKSYRVTLGDRRIVELLVELGAATSNSEAIRLVEQGGVKLNGTATSTTVIKIKSGDVIQVGKRRFYRLLAK